MIIYDKVPLSCAGLMWLSGPEAVCEGTIAANLAFVQQIIKRVADFMGVNSHACILFNRACILSTVTTFCFAFVAHALLQKRLK